MKRYSVIVLLTLVIGFILFFNSTGAEVDRLTPDKTTLPDRIAEEIPQLYVENAKAKTPYYYIFDPEIYETKDDIYILIATIDIEMKVNIYRDSKIVELEPLVYPHLYKNGVWYSEDFGDDSEELSYKFTMHRVNIKNASEYEFNFVKTKDPSGELRKWVPKGSIGASAAHYLPQPMKKR